MLLVALHKSMLKPNYPCSHSACSFLGQKLQERPAFPKWWVLEPTLAWLISTTLFLKTDLKAKMMKPSLRCSSPASPDTPAQDSCLRTSLKTSSKPNSSWEMELYLHMFSACVAPKISARREWLTWENHTPTMCHQASCQRRLSNSTTMPPLLSHSWRPTPITSKSKLTNNSINLWRHFSDTSSHV